MPFKVDSVDRIATVRARCTAIPIEAGVTIYWENEKISPSL
jgi:hypothetical protein